MGVRVERSMHPTSRLGAGLGGGAGLRIEVGRAAHFAKVELLLERDQLLLAVVLVGRVVRRVRRIDAARRVGKLEEASPGVRFKKHVVSTKDSSIF